MIRMTTAAAALAVIAATAAIAGAQERTTATARIVDSHGHAIGIATIVEGPHGLVITFDLTGLPPGWHAVHIHAHGTCADHEHGFVASGPHFNPDGQPHGFLNPDGPDFGDLPNLFAREDGSVRAEVFSTFASLTGAGGRPALLDADGAALVIHANPDDHLTQPIGGAGPRIACGVIVAD